MKTENNLNNLPPFYVGQKVVSIESFDCLVEGHVYTVIKCHLRTCGCGWVVEVNIPNISVDGNRIYKGMTVRCSSCKKLRLSQSNNACYFHRRFRPLQESVFPSLTMSKVVEKESQLISMN